MNINYRKAIENEIGDIISRSDLPEDYVHARGVKEWVIKFRPDADWALQLAAFAHDIERALPQRKVIRSKFSDYNDFKNAHALNSAKVIQEILDKYPLSRKVKNKILSLIRNHELGLTNDVDIAILKDADSLSFFEVNLLAYAERNDESEILSRMIWGYQRLSKRARQIVKEFHYENERLNEFLQRIILSEEKSALRRAE
ncbi:MAG: DUF4202 family protein [Candidatus Aminicenantes bacterium]|nr:MAG: DUF4202 family protein [Candidatus Aminicenantes bacterium]